MQFMGYDNTDITCSNILFADIHNENNTFRGEMPRSTMNEFIQQALVMVT